MFLAMRMTHAGEWERGLAIAEKALALNPIPPRLSNFTFHCYYYLRHDFERALSYALRVQMPGFFIYHATLAADYGQLGKQAEAKAALAELEKVYPNFGAHAREEMRKQYWREQDVELYLDGLRKAGLEIPPKEEAPKPAAAPARS